MSLKFEHPPLLVRKVERILARLLERFPVQSGTSGIGGRIKKDVNYTSREAASVEMTGMGYKYLRDIANPKSKIREPSGRVMKNLGIEIWVKDKETGEMEQVDFFGRCEIDFTDPTNPKLIEE